MEKVHLSELIEKIYVIVVKDRSDVWDEHSGIDSRMERFNAIDTRVNPEIYKDYGFTISGINNYYKLYFALFPGAIGCYLSHYLLWKKMVDEGIGYALILEDDANFGHVEKALKDIGDDGVYFNMGNIPEVTILNRRLTLPKNRLFIGTEAYGISIDGARRLISRCREIDNPVDKKIDIIYKETPDLIKFIPKIGLNGKYSSRTTLGEERRMTYQLSANEREAVRETEIYKRLYG